MSRAFAQSYRDSTVLHAFLDASKQGSKKLINAYGLLAESSVHFNPSESLE